MSALLREMISSLSGESAALRTRMRAAGDELRLAAGRAAPAAAARAQALADLRAPLALLAAVNDVSTHFTTTTSYLTRHHPYLQTLASLTFLLNFTSKYYHVTIACNIRLIEIFSCFLNATKSTESIILLLRSKRALSFLTSLDT